MQKASAKRLPLTESKRSPALTPYCFRVFSGTVMQPPVFNVTQQQGFPATVIISPSGNWKLASLGFSSNRLDKTEFLSSDTVVKANPPERALPDNKITLHGGVKLYSASASSGTAILTVVPTSDQP